MKTPLHPQRQNTRLPGYDYAQPGAYFVTICTHNRISTFGVIQDGQMMVNQWGEAVTQIWNELPSQFSQIQLDEFVVMPNHVHGIIVIIDEGGPSLSDIVRSLKSCTSHRIAAEPNNTAKLIWQRGFYDHVIRNEKSLQAIREYIINNPANWVEDDLNPQRVSCVYD